ncbi:hypothetical protein [Parvularcula maris]|uniref:PhyR sigma4 domain-containing protein n=1 Tax=Parvularcula maris TaxID=2965077 RepID=A0A9X2L6T3_9PROT|nr:hypothetical protein [Parvularcula maris]MCQ8184100.1 hypothetical protein [Parvularcula maris]
MLSYPDPSSGQLQARLSRFALCIASSTADAYSAVEEVGPKSDLGNALLVKDAFRRVVSRLDGEDNVQTTGAPPHSLVARYSCLPYHQRVAFALVVIEEFSLEEAAMIMGLGEEDIRQLLLAVRDFLFTSHWSTKCDA